MEQKEQLLEAVFGTMRSRQGIHCHVATLGQPCRSQRRHHVATSARKSASHHLMPDGSEIRASGGVRPEARISRAKGSRLQESARDLYRFPFLLDII